MDCCQFREKYSEFADGLLSEAEEVLARAHLSRCASCRRLDGAFRAGIGALRRLPPVPVSGAFRSRLRSRLRSEVASRFPAMYGLSGAVGALLVVATVGFVALDLVESHRSDGATRASMAVTVTPPAPTLQAAAVARLTDTSDLARDPLHPLEPASFVADTPAVALPTAVRLDIPAVWGGQ